VLLHDTVEDTILTLEDIKKEFGESVANLVDGVTKLNQIKFSSKEAKQAENFRKMILAMAQDIRVVFVKLADRLHNMRTLEVLSSERKRKIAQETLEIYAPLANRLGMQWVKIELEDLCLKYLKPHIYESLEKATRERRTSLENYMERVQQVVENKLDEYKIPHEMKGRMKHLFSIYRKMESQHLSFEQVHDLIAFRIIVDSIRQCYEALGCLHELWKPVPGRFKDYIAMPKINNYQSLHTTVVCLEGQHVEFQIRTKKMHETNEGGVAAHWNYKEHHSLDIEDQRKFQWLRDLVDLQKNLSDPDEFLDTVKLDLFAADVYVFTPQGDLIELPYGSTPLDFAYAIHTDVGNQCVGGKVDGRIVPLDYVLRSGHTVEVLTKAGSRPKKDWLKFVRSSRARAKIRAEIKKDQRDRALELGREALSRELEKRSLKSKKSLEMKPLTILAKKVFKLEDAEALLVQIGYGKITANNVVNKLYPDSQEKQTDTSKTEPSLLQAMFQKVKQKKKSGIRVGGHDDILVSLAKCCGPLPGDKVTGFITRGRGVIVHQTQCDRVLANDPERRVDVEWEGEEKMLHRVKVKTVTVDKPGILASMTKKISNMGINIVEANIRTTGDQKALNIFSLEIKDRDELNRVLQNLETLEGVISVSKI
ncbi:MAG: bifunctional (p)ppGpp synthetase/guanosine-3',5'-bis(diphosphate) 3'-pyrophosphohydrolase, partial [Deltaproteobacteria bacterium]|nr:bifunctional (p)ppGpp synthetase/guanosine-3',5'-bis(diphosphate) 3'-pyrophosphohydrolase [Deltaproteobacteria bacterium]